MSVYGHCACDSGDQRGPRRKEEAVKFPVAGAADNVETCDVSSLSVLSVTVTIPSVVCKIGKYTFLLIEKGCVW